MDKKRILFIIDSLAAGGAEKVVLTLARTLQRRGHDLVLLTVRDVVEYALDFPADIQTLSFTKLRTGSTHGRFARRLRNHVHSLEKSGGVFDLIVSHLQLSNRLVRRSGLPGVHMCVHSALSPGSLGNRRGLRRWLKKRRLQRIFDSQDIIAVSQGIKTDLEMTLHVRPHAITVIYNPVDFEQVRTLARERNPFAGENYAVCVARLTELKRHDVLLQAYARANLEQKLLLLGEGPRRPALERLAGELGIAHRVIFAGFHQNPYPVIRDAVLSVLASEYEGLGMGLVESLVLGIPVVSTDCVSGPAEILVDDMARFLVPVGDADALARKMREAVEEATGPGIRIDPALLEKFDAERVADQYLALADRRRRPGLE